MAESVLRITIDSRQALINAQAVNKELQSIEKTGDFASKSMDSLSVATRTLAGHMAGLVTVGAAVSKMDAYTGLQNRLKLVTNSQVELNKAMSDTFNIAQKTRQSWESAAQVYQGFANNAKALGLTMSQTAQLTETVSKAVAISGGSAASSEAALIQFNQALGAGALRGEELNSVMEQTPGLAKAIAEGMGLTVGQLRTVAAQGKITSEELVKALTKAKSSVDDLFSKTDITIGQSLTLLNNELSKFVGEAGQSSGAAKTLADSIQVLSQNLGLIADGAVVAGVTMLSRALISQTVSTYQSVAASTARRNEMLAGLQASVQSTSATVAQTGAVAQYSAMQLADARATAVRMTGMQRLAYVQGTVIPLERASTAATATHTAAIEADTIAQNLNNAARSRSTMLLGLIGGPIGALTLGVVGLATGYMYMQKRADEANKKLEEQAAVAKKAKDELLALQGLEKDEAVSKMTAAFKLQNEALAESSSKINMQLNAIERLYKGNKDVVQVVQDARNGTISMNTAISKFNELRISKEVYNSIKQNTEEFVKNATEATNSKAKLSLFGIEVELSGRKAQTAKAGVDQNTESLVDNAKAARDAAKAHQDFFDSLDKDVKTANQEYAMLGFGYSKEAIDKINELQEAKQKVAPKGTTAIVTQEEISQILQAQKALDAVKDREDSITKAKRDQTKETEKQQKLAEKQAVLLAGNNEQTRNMLRVYQAFRNTGLGDKQARVMTAQVGRENDFRSSAMFGSHGDFNNGYTNTGFISWQKGRSANLMKFLQGQGVLDKNGKIQQNQDALDAMAKFLMQEVASTNGYKASKNALANDSLSYRELEKIIGQNLIGWDYNGNGKLGKTNASKHLAKQDGYYNQLSKLLGSDPENALSSTKMWAKFEDEAYKARAKTEEEIKQLQAKYDTEAIQRSKARDEEINQATILGQTQLLPKIKERYDAQDKLAELQIDSDLNSWKWNENQKLQYTYQTNRLRLDAEGRLGEDVKALAKKNLDEQMLYETQKRLQASSLGIGQIALDAQSYVRQKQNPNGFQQDQLDSETINKYRELQLQYSSQRGDIFDLVNDENVRNQQLLDAHEKFLIARKALDEKYQVDQKEVARNQFDAQLALYGRLLSTTSSTWGSMTQIMRDSAGEQSAIYKLMFGVQQTMAVATATINAYQAYSSVLAEPLIPIAIKLPLANTILGLGMANVGMIAGQAIAGFYTGGYTGPGGKFDPAGVVHKGEVVFSQEDIKRWGGVSNVEAMRKGSMTGFANGGYVGGTNAPAIGPSLPALPSFNESHVLDSINKQNSNKDSAPVITINVSIQSDGSSGVDVQGDASQNLKQFAQFIGTEVERVVRKECNQGGVIDREFRKRR